MIKQGIFSKDQKEQSKDFKCCSNNYSSSTMGYIGRLHIAPVPQSLIVNKTYSTEFSYFLEREGKRIFDTTLFITI